MNDEINLNEDISDILESIEWKKVSVHLILEFVLKFYKLIETFEMEKFFYESITIRLNGFNKTNQNGSSNDVNPEIIKLMINSIFSNFS